MPMPYFLVLQVDLINPQVLRKKWWVACFKSGDCLPAAAYLCLQQYNTEYGTKEN
jgi:hypothetical protein